MKSYKRTISFLILFALCINMLVPAFATTSIQKSTDIFSGNDIESNLTDTYYDSCELSDGSLLEARILPNGNLIISQSMNGIVISSTETDHTNSRFVCRNYSNARTTPNVKSISIESVVEEIPTLNENYSTFASVPTNPTLDGYSRFRHFANVSFRTQIGHDYFETPQGEAYVSEGQPGSPAAYRVHVSDFGNDASMVVSAFVEALGLFQFNLDIMISFLISLGVFLAEGVVAPGIDYANVTGTRHPQIIRFAYDGKYIDRDGGGYVVAMGNVEKNGKYANQTFYDGMCEYNILNKDYNCGAQLYSCFFTNYGTYRGMYVSKV